MTPDLTFVLWLTEALLIVGITSIPSEMLLKMTNAMHEGESSMTRESMIEQRGLARTRFCLVLPISIFLGFFFMALTVYVNPSIQMYAGFTVLFALMLFSVSACYYLKLEYEFEKAIRIYPVDYSEEPESVRDRSHPSKVDGDSRRHPRNHISQIGSPAQPSKLEHGPEHNV